MKLPPRPTLTEREAFLLLHAQHAETARRWAAEARWVRSSGMRRFAFQQAREAASDAREALAAAAERRP